MSEPEVPTKIVVSEAPRVVLKKWVSPGGDITEVSGTHDAIYQTLERLAALVKALREENAKLRLQNTDLCHQLLASPSVHAVSAEEEP